MSIPRSWSRSSTCRSDSGKRTYIITAKRMTSGEVLKYRNGFLIHGGYGVCLTSSSWIPLTLPEDRDLQPSPVAKQALSLYMDYAATQGR